MKNQIQFLSGYKLTDHFGESFNELAFSTFDTDLTEWLQKGYCEDTHIPFSYIYENKIIANASANITRFSINDLTYNTVQISTVMTHPNFRNRGLARTLIEKIIETYEKESDFFYLYANETVLNFYPKLGFEKKPDYSFTISKPVTSATSNYRLRRLNMKDSIDFSFTQKRINQRHIASGSMNIENNTSILYFHLLIELDDIIYYIKEEEMIVIFEIEGTTFHLYDIIATKPFDLKSLLSKIISKSIKTVHFHFEVKADNLAIAKKEIHSNDDVLFTKRALKPIPKELYFPLTARF